MPILRIRKSFTRSFTKLKRDHAQFLYHVDMTSDVVRFYLHQSYLYSFSFFSLDFLDGTYSTSLQND